jgi:hypothetical protein
LARTGTPREEEKDSKWENMDVKKRYGKVKKIKREENKKRILR